MLLLRSLVLLLSASLAVWGCEPRDFGNGATACKCTLKHCDSIAPLAKPGHGEVHGYVSSKDGDRLKHYKVKPNGSGPHADISVTIEAHAKTRQKIIGFGGAFTDAAGQNIAALPKELQTKVIDDYYSSDKGIGYTVGRIPIGGSDFSTRGYTYDDHNNDETLGKFALQFEDFHYKLPYLKMATQASAHKTKFFASPWSAPAWMKTNKELIHGGYLIGKPGQKYYKMFAKYFVKFLQEYHKQGVAVWGVTIENEPGAGANKKYKWNSLGFNETVERDFIRLDLGPELHAAGYTADKMKVMIYDDQLPWVKKYAEVVLADHEAAKYISGIAFHWYENNRGKKTDLDDLAKQFADKFILATEACEEWKGHAEHVSLGNWAAFDRYALDIIEDLNHWVAGWTDWNLALDLQGGPNWVGNFVDAPIIVNETEKSYYRQPFFYALAHFSKFLPPESVYVESKVEHSGQHQGRLEAAVFRRPDNATVLIVLNTGDKPTNLHLSHVGQTQFNDIIKAHAMHSFVF